jgi:hypothetical protein
VSAGAGRTPEPQPPGCAVCSDHAEAVEVIAGDPETALTRCRTAAGIEIEVDAGLVAAPAPGDRLLVHAGAAIARLGPGPGDG